MVVLDATFLLAIERDEPPAMEALARLKAAGEPLRIPATVWIDYLSTFDARRRHQAIEHLVRGASFEPVDRTIADEAARLQHDQADDGDGRPWADLIVAATCLRHQERLVSTDPAYDRVPGVVRVAPSSV